MLFLLQRVVLAMAMIKPGKSFFVQVVEATYVCDAIELLTASSAQGHVKMSS
jgi:hypothetical protein